MWMTSKLPGCQERNQDFPLTLLVHILSIQVKSLQLMWSRQHQGFLVYVPEPAVQ